MDSSMPHYLFLLASARESGHTGNTEWLARQAASHLPGTAQQTWLHLAHLVIPEFLDQRHTKDIYPMPGGDLKSLLDSTMECSDLVFVAPVYWFSFPGPLKKYLDHWSAWMRIPGLPFQEKMEGKNIHLITTSGNREKAQPMINSTQLCADFLSMNLRGVLWGKGGPPGAVQSDSKALEQAEEFFSALTS